MAAAAGRRGGDGSSGAEALTVICPLLPARWDGDGGGGLKGLHRRCSRRQGAPGDPLRPRAFSRQSLRLEPQRTAPGGASKSPCQAEPSRAEPSRAKSSRAHRAEPSRQRRLRESPTETERVRTTNNETGSDRRPTQATDTHGWSQHPTAVFYSVLCSLSVIRCHPETSGGGRRRRAVGGV